MKTANEMYQYVKENNFGQGLSKKWALRHFKIIENNLQSDEEVLMAFIGIHNSKSFSDHEGNYAYAITNKRMLLGQKKVIGENFKIVLLNQLNDVSLSTGLVMGTIAFDTLKENFNVMVDKKQTKNIMNKVHEVVF